jgi:hypothetical protein
VRAHAHHTDGDMETRVLQASQGLALHGLRSKGLLSVCIINHLAPLYIYNEGRKEGRNVCTCCFFGVPPPCVCVCVVHSPVVCFFSSFLAAVVVWRLLAGLCRLAPSAWFTRSCTRRVNVCVCVCAHMRAALPLARC